MRETIVIAYLSKQMIILMNLPKKLKIKLKKKLM